jgi:hypothetical protein
MTGTGEHGTGCRDLDAARLLLDKLGVLYWSKIRLLVLSWAFMLSAGIR